MLAGARLNLIRHKSLRLICPLLPLGCKHSWYLFVIVIRVVDRRVLPRRCGRRLGLWPDDVIPREAWIDRTPNGGVELNHGMHLAM